MTVYTIVMQKGGTGKTSTAVNLASAFTERGKSVLVVDFDPQGSLSACLGYGPTNPVDQSIYTLIEAQMANGQAPPTRNAIITTDHGFDLLPADISLSQAEITLVGAAQNHLVLQAIINTVKHDYEIVLIDCLPSLGLMALNAILASDQVIIPVSADYLSLHSLRLILQSVYSIREKFHPDLIISGILMTMIEPRTIHNQSVVTQVRELLDGRERVFENEIHKTVKMKEAMGAHMSILAYASHHPVSESYRRLSLEVKNSE